MKLDFPSYGARLCEPQHVRDWVRFDDFNGCFPFVRAAAHRAAFPEDVP